MPGSDVHDMSYYGKCMIGGILSCGLTHAVMCPVDIVKCRKQVSNKSTDYYPKSYRILSAVSYNFANIGQPQAVQEHWRRL